MPCRLLHAETQHCEPQSLPKLSAEDGACVDLALPGLCKLAYRAGQATAGTLAE